MKYIILEKSKQVQVKPFQRKGRYVAGYGRLDPRTKKFTTHTTVVYHSESTGEKILNALKKILANIQALKQQKVLTAERKKATIRKLEELKVRAEHFKVQKQRMAVTKILKEIRKELGTLETKKHKGLVPKKGREIVEGLKRLGYDDQDISRMGVHEAKAVYWNEIEKEPKK